MSLPKKTFLCEKELTISVISGKWKPMILWYLGQQETRRFCELKKMLLPVTQKILTNQLRELEEDLLIHREVYPVYPAKVEYSLTEHGKSIIPILEMMKKWGDNYKQSVVGYEVEIKDPNWEQIAVQS
ncbi:helix-turn-helix domain-containing protein [Paenibacillus validus]|uniref:winged helix-turn-helix transcriptional regulator n=1 Tax=Paenibacillus validus TaxID=44253 RepID=UPI000FD79257|nr:helix-turn-helix domain-containing protein [Paenibacillus validus]MED4602753.1 helix-turn-helix domain-containing protein [Paenibacillus validus]MED4607710.1 helix-turn-helix domain-containing protein [Paenibacillus validus]